MPDDVVVNAPAPAPAVTPDSPPAAPATPPQGYTGIAPAPAPAEPATPAVPAAAPTQDSPPQDDAVALADKRVKDAQAAMHNATQRAAALESELAAILAHPLLGPLVQKAKEQATAPEQPAPQEDPIAKAWQEYQAAPDDKTAFQKLIEFATARAKETVLSEVEQKRVQEENERRAAQRNVAIVQTINNKVTEAAPEVPLQLFWSMVTEAEKQTPAELTDPAKRLDWQVNKTIELSRTVLAASLDKMKTATAQSDAVKAAAAAIIPAGGAAPAPSGGGAAPGAVPTFVDQIKASQRAYRSI